MNSREQRLLILLIVLFVIGGSGLLGYRWFYKPLQDYNAQIRRLKREIDNKGDELAFTIQELPYLERARLMSLSPNLETAKDEYGSILAEIVRESGLEVDDMRAIESVEVKNFAQQQTAKPAHRIVTYQVRVRGDMAHLVKAMTAMKTTPLIHRIRTLDIARQDTTKSVTDRLNISMRVEAMIVSQAEPHADGPLAPDQRLVVVEALMAMQGGPASLGLLPWYVGPTGVFARQALAMESGYRQYGDMARKNIFRGGGTPPREPGEEDEEDPVPEFDVTDYVRLDTCDPDHGEAYLRNLVFNVRPTKLRTSTWSGYNTFRVYTGELKTHTLLTGKVLRVEQRDVYFQVLNDIYCIHLGQTLHDAMWRPVAYDVRDRLNLRVDDAWAEQQKKEHQEQQAQLVAQKKKKASR